MRKSFKDYKNRNRIATGAKGNLLSIYALDGISKRQNREQGKILLESIPKSECCSSFIIQRINNGVGLSEFCIVCNNRLSF